MSTCYTCFNSQADERYRNQSVYWLWENFKAKGETACQLPTKIPIHSVSHGIPRENSDSHFLYNQGVFAKQMHVLNLK